MSEREFVSSFFAAYVFIGGILLHSPTRLLLRLYVCKVDTSVSFYYYCCCLSLMDRPLTTWVNGGVSYEAVL